MPSNQEPQLTPEQLQQQQQQEQWQKMLKMLDTAKPFIINMIKRGDSGADFADMIIDYSDNGNADYLALKELGRDALLSILVSHPDIKKFLDTVPTTAINKFVDEFINRDEIRKAEEEAEEGEEE